MSTPAPKSSPMPPPFSFREVRDNHPAPQRRPLTPEDVEAELSAPEVEEDPDC